MLAVTQILSWSAMPVSLCISENGSVCVDLGQENCVCCRDTNHEHGNQPACCGRCDASEPDDLPAVAQKDGCDCLHLPLMSQQDEALRSSLVADLISDLALVGWVNVTNEFIPRTDLTPTFHWRRSLDFSPHLAVIATTVIRC